MEGLRFGQSGEKQRSLRAWIVLLVTLPPAFLGAAYFLFIEYVLQDFDLLHPTVLLTLRLGGLGLIAIALVLAAAFGYLLAERVSRPLRLLLRLSETGDLASNRPLFERERGPEVLELHRLLSTLLTQNKAGARALEELERLRAGLATLREELARTGQHGIPPAVTVSSVAPLGEISAGLEGKRIQLLSFFHELKERVAELRKEYSDLGGALGFQLPRADDAGEAAAVTPEERKALEGSGAELEPALPESPPGSGAQTLDALVKVRHLATVLTLEAARLGGSIERVQALQARFESGLGDLEGTLVLPHRSNGSAELARAEEAKRLRRVSEETWSRLVQGLATLERLLGEVEER